MENLGGNTGTVDWGVRVERSDEDLDLGVDSLLLFRVFADDREGAHTLAVETLSAISNENSGFMG